MKLDKRIKGIFLASISAATYGLNPLFAIPLYRRGMSVESVLCHRYWIGCAILGIMLLVSGRSFKLKAGQIIPQICCGVIMSLSSIFLFSSYNHMDIGIASTLLFVYPVFVALIMTGVFREKMSLWTAVCLVLAVLGVVVLNWGGGSAGSINVTGVLLALGSALTWALYLIIVRKTSLASLDAQVLTFYSLLSGLPVFLFRMNWGLDLNMPDSVFSWGTAVLIAVLPTIVSMVAAAAAVQCIGPTVTSVFGAMEPLTAVLIGVFVFGEPFSINLAAGFLIIVFSVTSMALKK